MRRRLLAVSLVVLSLSACERRDAAEGPSPDAPRTAQSPFVHRLGGDVSGDYRPVAETDGDWRVAGLFVGQEAAFQAWEAGSRSNASLILTLVGPQGTAEIRPDAYVVTDEVFRFTGRGPDGAEVSVQGRIDQGALATARRNLGDRTPVVTGVLTVGGRASPFSLGRWGGD